MTRYLGVLLMVAAVCRAQTGKTPRFVGAEECALCHTRIPEAGENWSSAKAWVGPFALWKGSMMAQASRDPYWMARVGYEEGQAPGRRAEIESLCTRCHAPAGSGETGKDGVTCTVCHQIQAAGLGEASSFTGGFRIGVEDVIFGPHSRPFAMPMLHHTGFEPQEARHILDAALCGTCHTVVTNPPREAGAEPVLFVEQAPFLEWLASSYPKEGRTCQRCHMPQLTAAQYIAHRPPGGAFPPTAPRLPFGKHEFAGGNVRVAELMGSNAGERARRQLERALRLQVTAERADGFVQAKVEVVNLSGHKLPTGFPSRRMWLHVRLMDEQGRAVFESGGWDEESGELRAGEGFQAHHVRIERAEQVQVFETELADGQNRATLSLLMAARHRKDNRILPAGWDVQRLKAAGLGAYAIDAAGTEGDDGFRAGAARTEYRIPAPQAGGKYRLEVEVVYQTVKPSHAPASFGLSREILRPVVVVRSEGAL